MDRKEAEPEAIPDLTAPIGEMMAVLKYLRTGLALLLLVAVSSILPGCQQILEGLQPPPGQLTEIDLTRTTSGASITVTAAFMNPLLDTEEAKGRLIFKVKLDTHSENVMRFDLINEAVLRTNEGIVMDKGFTWEPQSESEHHRSGLLKIAAIVDGKPLVTQDTKYIELELKEIGIPSRLFKWEKAYLILKGP